MNESKNPLYFCTICQTRWEDDPNYEFTHEQCKKILSMGDEELITARISLAYYKQGDDLNASYKYCKGDPIAAFENLAQKFEGVVAHLREIADELKGVDPEELTLEADTHHISISGSKKHVFPLITKELASLDP